MCKSQGGYSTFQAAGMIAGFLGFEIFDFGIFWVGKFGKYFFVCVCVCVWLHLRALDSISLLRYVVTMQMQFYFRFSSTACSVRRPNFTLFIVFFPLESFSNHKNVFCSKMQNL